MATARGDRGISAAQLRAVHPRLLLVGKNDLMRESARALVAQDGYLVFIEPDGNRAVERQRQEHFDAIIVDLESPPFNRGRSFETLWGRSEAPVLVLTARADANDAIAALEVGAHDYLKKPFDPAELAARVRRLLRSSSWIPQAKPGGDFLSVGDLIIDAASFRVWKGGRELCLSVTEFNLLLTLIQNAGQTLTRETLLEKVWSCQFLGRSRLVDMTIVRLRKKIEDDPKRPQLVRTVKGVGYRYANDLLAGETGSRTGSLA